MCWNIIGSPGASFINRTYMKMSNDIIFNGKDCSIAENIRIYTGMCVCVRV